MAGNPNLFTMTNGLMAWNPMAITMANCHMDHVVPVMESLSMSELD